MNNSSARMHEAKSAEKRDKRRQVNMHMVQKMR